MTQPTSQEPVVCCEGKDPLSAERAKEVASRMSQRGKRVAAYKCPNCLAYHVGRPVARSLHTRRALQRRKGSV